LCGLITAAKRRFFTSFSSQKYRNTSRLPIQDARPDRLQRFDFIVLFEALQCILA
jgi:hypothetical protein